MSQLAAWKLPFGGAQAAATATGSNQAGALAITASNVEVTTTAASTGVRLPTAVAGMRIVIANRGANTLSVYPATGGTIDALGANLAFSLATNTQVVYFASTANQWYSIQTSSGGSSGSATSETIPFANAFSAGNVIKHTAASYSKAQADTAANAEVFGVVSAASGANFTVYYSGKMALAAHGFTDAAVLFLSQSVAGLLTATEPTTPGQVSRPVAIVYDANTLLIIPQRGMVIPSATTVSTLKKSVNQVAHGLSAENIIRHNGTIWTKAQADSAANSEATAVVESITDVDNFVLVEAGDITLGAKTANTEYFLSSATAGLLTSAAPSAGGTVKRSILRMTTTTAGIVRIAEIGIQN